MFLANHAGGQNYKDGYDLHFMPKILRAGSPQIWVPFQNTLLFFAHYTLISLVGAPMLWCLT